MLFRVLVQLVFRLTAGARGHAVWCCFAGGLVTTRCVSNSWGILAQVLFRDAVWGVV